MQPEQPSKKRVLVAGAGISGLSSAEQLIERGYDVTIVDAEPRVGGKIRTVSLGDAAHKADMAAEFIDSDQTPLIDLAKKHNVPLISQGSLNETFHLPNGKTITSDEFYEAYKPLALQIVADKAVTNADPTGNRAEHLDSLSLAGYFKELAAAIPDDRPLLQRIILFWQKPRVDPDIITMAEQVFAGEAGRPAHDVSALQFVHEAGATMDTIIASDCAYRVDGGTSRLIEAMETSLKAKGAHFILGQKVESIQKNGGGFSVGLSNGEEKPVDKVVFALAAHPLSKIKGLEAAGLSKQALNTLDNMQYTHNSKITVRIKDTPENKTLLHDEGFFYSDGYQAWQRPGENSQVFLIGDNLPNEYKKPAALVRHVLEDFAKAHNTTADQLFDMQQLKYQGPGMDKSCYASPSQGQSLKLHALSKSFDALATQGIGFAGTYIPGKNGAIGFMNQGLESAARATSILDAVPSKAQTLYPEIQTKFTDKIRAASLSPPARSWALT